MRNYAVRLCQVLSLFAISSAIVFLSTRDLSADSFDWRSFQGHNWNSTIKSQFGGTCWDFSSCGTLEAKYKLTRNDYSYNPDVSEEQVCWETNPDMGSTGGGWGSSVLSYFTSHGVVADSECPYQSSSPDVGIVPYWPLGAGWESRVFKTTSNQNGFTNDTATMKAALKTYGPLEVGIWASHDLFRSVADLKANYRAPSSEQLDHEVSLVGYYDDADVPTGGYWVIKNSWGTGEGAAGYDYIPYGNIEIHNDVSAITGAAYYTGSMASATWKGGTTSWSKNGTNWTNNSGGATYTWQNYETSATFAGSGTAVTVSGTVIAHGMTINAGATSYSFSGGALTLTAGGITANESVTITSPVTVGAPQTWTVASGKSLSIGSIHTIISPLTIQATGSATITGSTDGGGALNAAGALPGTINKTGGGTLYLTGNATYAAPLNLTAGKLDFAQASGVSANFTNVISGNGPVIKSSGGIVRLSGANTYSGETDVNAGLLLVNGSLKAGALTLVNNGGTVGGTGTLGSVRVGPGGHLAPGDGAGTLSIAGFLTLNAGAKLDFDLDTPLTSDTLYMPNSVVSIGGQSFSDFTFNALSNFNIGTYLLIDAKTIAGSLSSNNTGWIGDKSATLSISNGDLLLTVVPEPSVLVSLLAGVIGMFAYAKRRRK